MHAVNSLPDRGAAAPRRALARLQSGPQLLPHRAGPALDGETMCLEQGHDDALEAETQAGGIGSLAIERTDLEGGTKVLLMKIEGADGGRILGGDHRHQHFEF